MEQYKKVQCINIRARAVWKFCTKKNAQFIKKVTALKAFTRLKRRELHFTRLCDVVDSHDMLTIRTSNLDYTVSKET